MSTSPRSQLETALAPLVADVAEGDPTVQEQRDGYDMFGELIPLRDDAEIVEADAWGVPLQFISTPRSNPDRKVLVFHGGGYVIGSFKSHGGWASRFADRTGSTVVLVGYRLAPEHPFPAAVDDAVQALEWLQQSDAPDSIAVAGDSAGGGLALAALVAARDRGMPMVAGAALMSPWTDLSFTGESLVTRAEQDPMVAEDMIRVMADHYVSSADSSDPLVSPVYANLTGLCPLQIHVGDDEILLDDSRRIGENARRDGVECSVTVWDEMLHVFPYFAPLLPEGHPAWQATDQMGQFIAAATSS